MWVTSSGKHTVSVQKLTKYVITVIKHATLGGIRSRTLHGVLAFEALMID